MTDKLFGALSLSKKAGKLYGGFGPVMDKLYKDEVYLLFFAKDYAEASRQKAMKAIEEVPAAKRIKICELPYTQMEMVAITGKTNGIFAVCDKGLAKLCLDNFANATV